MNGISLLLLEKGMPGLSVRKVICQGNACAGTAYVMMENVKVPVKNIVGKLNKGFKVIWPNATRKMILRSFKIGHHV
jgi:alkylation response protein AidB-like acyl-CoA dehydrogenase